MFYPKMSITRLRDTQNLTVYTVIFVSRYMTRESLYRCVNRPLMIQIDIHVTYDKHSYGPDHMCYKIMSPVVFHIENMNIDQVVGRIEISIYKRTCRVWYFHGTVNLRFIFSIWNTNFFLNRYNVKNKTKTNKTSEIWHWKMWRHKRLNVQNCMESSISVLWHTRQ